MQTQTINAADESSRDNEYVKQRLLGILESDASSSLYSCAKSSNQGSFSRSKLLLDAPLETSFATDDERMVDQIIKDQLALNQTPFFELQTNIIDTLCAKVQKNDATALGHFSSIIP